MHSPISKYPNFQLEVQDVFANFFLEPSRPPAAAVLRGNPYSTYTYHAYTTGDLEAIMNNAGSLVSSGTPGGGGGGGGNM